MSLTFKQLRKNLSEAKKFKIPAGEKKVKDFTVGKSKSPAILTKKGSKFVVYINDVELDKFRSERDAMKAANDFAKLMDK